MKHLQLYEGFQSQIQANYQREQALEAQEKKLAAERQALETQDYNLGKEWLAKIESFVKLYGAELPTGEIRYEFNYKFSAGKNREDVLLALYYHSEGFLTRTLQSEAGKIAGEDWRTAYGYDFQDEGAAFKGMVMDAMLAHHPDFFEGEEMGFFNKEQA